MITPAGSAQAGETADAITRQNIGDTYDLIRPYVRRTPIMEVDAGELIGTGRPQPHGLVLKLEQLQCAGSFKARGAFANLLLRPVPTAGVAGAQAMLWETVRVVAEPAAVVGVAALITGAYQPEPGERVAVVVSGANTTLRR